MEVLSAVATVVTLFSAALASTRAFHHVLSATKHGSLALQALSNEVEQLQKLLETISTLPIQNTPDVADLARYVRDCVTDVAAFKLRLELLTVSEANSRSGRLWRRVKASVNEKDLWQMQRVICGHVGMLNGRLTTLQITMLAQHMAQSSHDFSLVQQFWNDTAIFYPLKYLKSLPTLSNGALTITSVPESTQFSNPELEIVLSRLIRLLEYHERTVNSEDVLQIMQHLEIFLESARWHECESNRASGGRNLSCFQENIGEELKLVISILSLASSVNINTNTPSRVPDCSVQRLISHQQRKRKTIDLGGVELALCSTKRQMTCTGHRFRNDANRTASETTDGETANNRVSNGETTNNLTRINKHKLAREFSALLRFKPIRSHRMVELSVHQAPSTFDNVVCIPPRICIINIRPRDSRVFQLAADGNKADLMALIAQDGANLRDHDTRGWSLLHHALPHPELCQFLIQEGLDVDEMVPLHEGSTADRLVTPLHMAYLRNLDKTAETLLRGGGDPTVELPRRHSVLHLVSGQQTSASNTILRHIFDISAYYGVATMRVTSTPSGQLSGWSALLSACYIDDSHLNRNDRDPQSTIRKLSFLLDRGSNVHDTADDGSNCLHIFFTSRPFLAVKDGWKQALVYLIHRGADIHGKDGLGWSVTSLAYGDAFDERCALECGSYLGDLWDAVLDYCGHNILDFRRSHPRRASYCVEYERADFEKLWEGREQRCPYWNDVVWPQVVADLTRNRQDENRSKRCRLPWVHGV
ncbi:hypothetical protein EDB81DRAFT_814489 [Dactylonectria macrodidyma]|uniref:Azaphilone pigments biosynthesis cluster protein L N-terminal domain-containing protein n=1 Tax=Dactylonectria macrodidyma TaxID=307937 RepID=A0A9P9DK13_9HYPO|nr:hypothetical protein EDB81DRAFT_814489 [Dactylonectria macrodidyma]